ncbi:MAG: 50S ribosomal protein L24 [Planctomycetota bacterium]
MNIRRNDTVVLLKDFSGPSPSARGDTARVLRVFPKEGKLICESVNVKHKHIRANTNRDYPRGGIIEKEAAIDISNVALYCPHCESKTKARRKLVDGRRVRVCKKCGEPIEANL